MQNANDPITTPCHTVDDDTQAELVRLIVTAEIEDQQLEGAECYAVEIQVELRSNSTEAAEPDAIFKQVEACFYGLSTAALGQAGTLFEVLIFYPERMTSEDARAQNTRHRERSFPFDVLENVYLFKPEENLMFTPSGDLMFA